MSSKMDQIFTIHRYWMWANAMRTHFDKCLTDKSRDKKQDISWFADYEGVFLSHWYAALFVVIEGWHKMKLKDQVIDDLLSSSNVDLLRRFRNGVCHFQPNYLDDRFIAFMAEPTTVAWVRKLNTEFGRYFLQTLASESDNVSHKQ